MGSLTLNLRYEGQKNWSILSVIRSFFGRKPTDFDGILNQLRKAENLEEIKFLTSGVGGQDNQNIFQIIKKILTKPKFKQNHL